MLSRIALRSALGLGGRLSPRAARGLARLLASIQYRLAPARRAAVLANLEAIAAAGGSRLKRPEDRERTARAIFESYQRFLLEYLGQSRGFGAGPMPATRFAGMERLYRAVALGRGAIVAAAHLGNWEGAALALARLGFRTHVVTGLQFHAALAPAARLLKEERGIAVSTPQDGFYPLVAALRRRSLVILMVDGDVYGRSIAVPFFERRVPFPAGPALLARRTDAPIVHAHARREEDGALTVSIDALDEADRSLPLARDLERLTGRVAAIQERNIARSVSQWCIFRSLFDAGAAPRAAASRSDRRVA